MRRRLVIVPILLAAALGIGIMPARAEQRFLAFFQSWSADIEPAAGDVIAAAAVYARQNPTMRLDIVGYADATGSQKANLYLSLLRAQVVNDRLAELGIAPDRLVRVGEGATTAVGSMQESRRVDIIVHAP